jgi:hypothetical protein
MTATPRSTTDLYFPIYTSTPLFGMGRRDVFLRAPILPEGKRRLSERSWPGGRKDPSSTGRYLDQGGNLREQNSLLKATNERRFNVNTGRGDIGFSA